jgi:hypothetical protein
MLKIAVMSAGIVGGIFTGDVPLAMIFGFVMMLGLLADAASVPSLSPLVAQGSRSRSPFLSLPGIFRKTEQARRQAQED